jgi:hypothetical protein
MRDDWDGRYKELLSAALEGTGDVLRGLESGAVTQRMDVVFRPDAAHRAVRLRRGLLGQLTDAGECDLEPFRNTPSVGRVRGCLRRTWTYHHVNYCADDDARADEVVTRTLVLSPGTPTGVMETWSMRPHATLPRGVYVTPPGIGLWVVVIAELPATRATLALRLLGRNTLSAALDELAVLPKRAWERKMLLVLLRWRVQVQAAPVRTSEEEEFMQQTRDLFEQFQANLREEGRTKGRKEGMKRGLKKGLEEGLEKGLLPLQHLFARRLGRPLTTAETATLRTRFDTVGPGRLGDVVLDLAPDALAAWLADDNAV